MSLDSVSIINLALDRIGQQPIANMGQTTGNGPLAMRQYDKTRRACLSETWWTFARSETPNGLPLVSNNVWSNWQYAYEYPNDCLIVNYLCNPNLTSQIIGYPYTPAYWNDYNRNNPHEITVALAADKITATGQKIILSNMEDAILVYTKDVAESLMTDLFVDYLVAKLAKSFCLRLLPQSPILRDLDSEIAETGALAKRHSANEAVEPSTKKSDFERYRQ